MAPSSRRTLSVHTGSVHSLAFLAVHSLAFLADCHSPGDVKRRDEHLHTGGDNLTLSQCLSLPLTFSFL